LLPRALTTKVQLRREFTEGLSTTKTRQKTKKTLKKQDPRRQLERLVRRRGKPSAECSFLDGQGLKLRLAVRDRFSRNSFTMSLVPPAPPPRLSYLTEI
jgi:hypothetical protein